MALAYLSEAVFPGHYICMQSRSGLPRFTSLLHWIADMKAPQFPAVVVTRCFAAGSVPCGKSKIAENHDAAMILSVPDPGIASLPGHSAGALQS